MDEQMAALIEQMKQAADQDLELHRQKQPAIYKLKLLPTVLTYLAK